MGSSNRLGIVGIFLILAVSTIQAAGWIAADVAVDSIPPLTLASLRFLLAGVVVACIARLRGAPLFNSSWRSILVVAVLGVALSHALYYGGLQLASVGEAVIINTALTPLLVAMLAVPILGERVSPRGWLGIAMCVVGATLAVMDPVGVGTRYGHEVGIVLLGAAAATAALYTVIGRVALDQSSPLAVVAVSSIIGGALLLPFSVLENGGPPQFNWTLEASVAFVYLAVPSAALSGVLYFALVQRSGAARGSLVNYLVPVMVLTWEFIAVGAGYAPARILGAGLAIAGVWMTSGSIDSRRDQKPAAGAHPNH